MIIQTNLYAHIAPSNTAQEITLKLTLEFTVVKNPMNAIFAQKSLVLKIL